MSEERANITLQDVALVVNIIDAAVKRGAIEGNEMSLVGGVRDKFERFVKENSPQPEPIPEEETD